MVCPVTVRLGIAGTACGPGEERAEATLANKINAISNQRWQALQELKVDVDRVRGLLGP